MRGEPTDNYTAYYSGNRYGSFRDLHRFGSMQGPKRVIIFCVMTTVLPTVLIIIPLYLRHIVFADVSYNLSDSDVVEITEGISSIFCGSHSLQMNKTFNAFQLVGTPEVSTKRNHLRLKKSMNLPDDTLEYWGFYLLKGATVQLKVCSRYEGSRILVVRGERNLRTCGLTEHNLKKFGATLDQEHNQVKVTFQSAREIDDAVSSVEAVEVDDANVAAEDMSDDDLVNGDRLKLVRGRKSKAETFHGIPANHKGARKERHHLQKFLEKQEELYKLEQELEKDEDIKLVVDRTKRNAADGHIFDNRIEHGGNAINHTGINSNENSASSFETELSECYDGQILLMEGFSPSHLCTDVHFLEKGDHMETIHDIVSDGYYYYIFYSDNDFVSNDIHALFDIFKPTLKFANISDTKSCVNKTECEFAVSFWSDESVIVEVPVKDGINTHYNMTSLLSTCHPRMSVYIIFPIAIMFLILSCAFM